MPWSCNANGTDHFRSFFLTRTVHIYLESFLGSKDTDNGEREEWAISVVRLIGEGVREGRVEGEGERREEGEEEGEG